MLEFVKAAEAKEKEAAPDEDTVDVNLWGRVFKARRPTPAQSAILVGSGSRSLGEQTQAIFGLIEAMMGARARLHVQALIMSNDIEISDLLGGNERNEHGVIDAVLEEFTGRPTQPSTVSSSSRATGGRKSTGRRPGPGSTASTSPSTDS